ncbi:MAG: hypothetical protein KC483_10790 [Nitrosarchaeum sp.]|nr:hypothetical protein [Nitrosarchaeum sp.]
MFFLLSISLFSCGPDVYFYESPFLRGDANRDGMLDEIDLQYISELIGGVRFSLCQDSADANDDGVISEEDLDALHNYFDEGLALKPPFPQYGMDQTKDDLGPCL